MMERKHRVLLVPDAYLGDYSGAYVAQIAKRLLIEMGHKVAVFTSEVNHEDSELDGTKLYTRRHFSSKANWLEKTYRLNYERVLDDFQPDVVYTLGSVTNKNVCYWRIARNRGIKVVSKIFMQDFFCYNYYANDKNGLCTKCLDNGFKEALFHKCVRSADTGFVGFVKKINSTINRYRLQKELIKADAVITSSHQQVDFYVRYGIPREHCYITPLYFNGEKLKRYIPTKGDYYVFVAQNRIDKGIHLLKDVLEYCNSNVRVVAAFASQKSIDYALNCFGLRPYVEKGILEMKLNCTWNTNLGETIAASRGVINPSIWPSTTEYVLLETLGLKKPIFTFSVGIHSEIIESGVNGFVAKTPKQMAEQLNDFLLYDQQYETVSQNAWVLYKKLTDWDKWKDDLNIIFDNIYAEK